MGLLLRLYTVGRRPRLAERTNGTKKGKIFPLSLSLKLGSEERRYEGEKKEEKRVWVCLTIPTLESSKKRSNSEVTQREVARKKPVSITESLERNLADKEENTFRHFPHSKKKSGTTFSHFPTM